MKSHFCEGWKRRQLEETTGSNFPPAPDPRPPPEVVAQVVLDDGSELGGVEVPDKDLLPLQELHVRRRRAQGAAGVYHSADGVSAVGADGAREVAERRVVVVEVLAQPVQAQKLEGRVRRRSARRARANLHGDGVVAVVLVLALALVPVDRMQLGGGSASLEIRSHAPGAEGGQIPEFPPRTRGRSSLPAGPAPAVAEEQSEDRGRSGNERRTRTFLGMATTSEQDSLYSSTLLCERTSTG
eukprot:761596-Hanusia_phi.AAC.3